VSRPWPPIDEMRAVCQPPSVTGRRNAEHWTASLFGRTFSIYLTRLAVWAGMSANTVTVVMILCGWAAAAALLIPGLWGPALACLLAIAQMSIDSIDGEVARWNRATGPRGIFLDRIAHTTVESLIPIALGLRIAFESSPNDWRWATLGSVLAVLILWNKSLMESARLARVESGLALPKDEASSRAPQPGLLRSARRLADFVPLHRMYHSVEQTIMILVLALAGSIAGFNGPSAALVLFAVAIPFVMAGHAAAILTSSLLKRPTP